MTSGPYTGLKAFIGAIFLCACQTSGSATDAVLETADEQSMSVLKSTLAGAMGQAQIELGPDDPTTSSTISVLPPRPSPSEDRSTITPTIFDIKLIGSDCYVVRRETNERYALRDVSCRAV